MHFRDSEWSNAECEIEGRKAFIRRNESVGDFGPETHPFTLLVNLVFREVDQEGLPADDAELDAADDLEERVAELVTGRFTDALFGLAVTTDGVRDLFFFLTAEPDEPALEAAINELDPPLDWDFGVTQEVGWIAYRSAE